MKQKERPGAKARVEIVFNIAYLSTMLVAAGCLYRTAQPGSLRPSFAAMALLLAGGDSFHLVPRVLTLLDGGRRDYRVALGLGKLITSLTMTLFYLFLWEIGKTYYGLEIPAGLQALVYGLAAVRIALCLFPQNRWTAQDPPVLWGILRNIPFVIQGFLVMVLFLVGSQASGGLPAMGLAIFISFLCYVPVVLWVHRKPALGMLMLPKSLAYVAMVLMGFSIY